MIKNRRRNYNNRFVPWWLFLYSFYIHILNHSLLQYTAFRLYYYILYYINMQNSWLPMCYKSLHTSSYTNVLYSSSVCDSASRMFHHIKMKLNAAQMKSQPRRYISLSALSYLIGWLAAKARKNQPCSRKIKMKLMLMLTLWRPSETPAALRGWTQRMLMLAC